MSHVVPAPSPPPPSPAPRSVVELRIHGVGGASPAYTLDDPDVFQTAGDEVSGFYRGAADPTRKEAYSWGGLTTGSFTRLLWILLLPFAIVNLAGFMFPEKTGPARSAYFGAVRLLGLTVTVFYTLWFASFAMDVLGYQVLGAVAGLPEWLSGAGARLALGALVAMLCVGGLHAVPHLTRIERPGDGDDTTDDPARSLTLASPSFWRGHRFVSVLAALHFAASLHVVALVCWLICGPPEIALGFGPSEVTAIMLVAIGVVALLELPRLVALLLGGAGLVNLVIATATLYGTAVPQEARELDVWDWPLRVNTLIAFLSLVVMVGSMWRTQVRWGPIFCYVLAVLTVHIGGAAMSVQGGRSLASLVGLEAAPHFPPAYHMTSFLTLGLGLLFLAWIGVIYWRNRGAEALSTAIHGKMQNAIRASVVIGLVLHFFYVVHALRFGTAYPGGMPSWIVTWGQRATDAITLGAVGALAYYFRNATNDVELRRNVGRIWDVQTFWPRWFHPLAPPTSSQRAVPELRLRLTALVDANDAVVVSAHSQGSVLAYVTLLGMGARANHVAQAKLSNLALLTHGSPLRRIYADFFPAYFAPEEFAALRERLDGRWTNLHRKTDPIGGQIFGEEAIADPVPRTCPLHLADRIDEASRATVLYEGEDEPSGHLHYDRVSQYGEARAALEDQLRTEPKADVSGVRDVLSATGRDAQAPAAD